MTCESIQTTKSGWKLLTTKEQQNLYLKIKQLYLQRCTFRGEKRNTETKPYNELTVASVLFPWQAKDCSDRESGKGEEEEGERKCVIFTS